MIEEVREKMASCREEGWVSSPASMSSSKLASMSGLSSFPHKFHQPYAIIRMLHAKSRKRGHTFAIE